MTCSLGDLAAGQKAQVNIVVAVAATTAPGVLLANQARVTAANGDPNLNNNAATLGTTVGPRPAAAGATPVSAATAVSAIGDVATLAPPARPAAPGTEEASPGFSLPPGLIIVIILAVALVAGSVFWWRVRDHSS